MNAAAALRDAPACRVEAIREVRVSLGKTQSQILCYRAPTNSLEAKFSVEFAAAAALLAGHVGLGELDEGYLQRRDVRELMARVVRVEIDEADPQQTLFSPADRVEIELTGGEVISGPQIRFAPGHARNPAAPSKLQSKFEDRKSTRLNSEEHTSELQSLMRISYAVFCLKQK